MGSWLILLAAAAAPPPPTQVARGVLTISAVVETGCTVKRAGRSVDVRCAQKTPHVVSVTPPGPGTPPRVTVAF